ncbi:hypothetical protein MNEG_10262 [Monoraphidium neglectum]|uniref:Uncharacterized protein n=1 Tax=Monoraphidium neglectum TaxID=145388 RepID=A0A0D2MTE6_9CHLO|nr:hypothetical protein MNEG_10262 [Monoraphidium neglectum]KIY97700.1 hypothetical protein MNEG_10262 [Monoraphidium neglectum]|eukprot:XP_013896720.1 hypothetical protein MNEG_10262 [Monoraphidium neglectum]
MTPDIALFQYGYLLPGEDPRARQPLSRVDEAGFDPEADLAGPDVLAPPRPPLTAVDPLERLRAEQQRVQALANALAQGRPAAEAAILAASDPTGGLLRDVLAWRVQRQEALGAEARRLAEEIAAAAGRNMSEPEGTQDDSGSGSGFSDGTGNGIGVKVSSNRSSVGRVCVAGIEGEGACSAGADTGVLP